MSKVSLPTRVASAISSLRTAAKDLNQISDELGKSISEIDSTLKKLNLGVAVWIVTNRHSVDSSFANEMLGYAKIGSTWGIAIRKLSGDHEVPEEQWEEEDWLFNDAPRSLRIAAIEKIPELIEELSVRAIETTRQIREKLSDVRTVVDAMQEERRTTIRVPLKPIDASSAPQLITVPETGKELYALNVAVTRVLIDAGFSTAAQLLSSAKWSRDGAAIRIEVPHMGRKMLALTVNAAAEHIIRTELKRHGASEDFAVVPAPSQEGKL
jgi:hypothetical protein